MKPGNGAALTARLRTPVKAGELLIAPSHTPGRFDSHSVDCPFVFTRDGTTGMTFVGWDGVGYQTALTWLNEDGTWTEPEVVFARAESSPHRRYNAALTSILRDNDLFGTGELLTVDGWYYGTYHAYPSAGYEEGSAVIGIVRSRDLREWEDFGDVLRPEDGADWERGGLYKSWLLEHEGRFWLFYNAKDDSPRGWAEQTGAAVSTDLVSWRRVSDRPLLVRGEAGEFDERFASDPCVLRADDTWVMFYFGLSANGKARDSFATSPDLLQWTKGGEILVDVGPPGSVDECYAHKPAVLWRDGVLEHYYCAVRRIEPIMLDGYRQNESRGISVARSA
ncbi:glycoside hydrolase family protein [Streptosporangium soli]|nr:hypothetical protein [Streptosporangium sp. KLBMP 9127]